MVLFKYTKQKTIKPNEPLNNLFKGSVNLDNINDLLEVIHNQSTAPKDNTSKTFVWIDSTDTVQKD